MRLLKFYGGNNQVLLGIETEKGIFNIDAYQQYKAGKLFSNANLTIDDLEEIQHIISETGIADKFYVDSDAIKIGSCVSSPSKIICIGLNYRQHAIESGMAIPAIPVVFTKYNNTLINYQQEVSLGAVGEQFDYEVELGVVIGKICKNVS